MKQIIWSYDSLIDDKARKNYQSFQREALEDDDYEVSDKEWNEEVNSWLDDERPNLDKEVDGIIIAFGYLELWYGCRQDYMIFGSDIAGILQSSYEDAEWYGDNYNIRRRMVHNDGTNYVLYRVAKKLEDAEHIAEKVYCGEIDEKSFRKQTCLLYPYVTDVYGWKVSWRK